MDIANTPAEFKDFFGVRNSNAGITKIQCPILAFYGTNGDVGNEKTLDLLKTSVQKSKASARVTAIMIKGAEHMYMGQEAQVVEEILKWINDIN